MIILDSLSANPSRPEFSLYAKQVQQKLEMLTIGSSPPTFQLYDQQMQLTTLEDFRGKYVYLFICTTDNYGCLSEYPFIMALHRKHSDYLAVVSIMVSETQEQMKSFMERNGYDWTALFYGNDRDLLRDYNVKAYPVAYLIGPDGKLIQSPATLATEGFEQQLFRIMRSRGDL
jgi:peroxiredoxin